MAVWTTAGRLTYCVGDSKDSVRVNRGYDLPHAGSTAPVGPDASAVCLASNQDSARILIVSQAMEKVGKADKCNEGR